MELPEEIVREIQLRLPVKSLVRFMCVSKHWLSSITDPKFTRLHLNHLRDQQNHHYNRANSTTNSSFPQSSVILSNFFTIRPIGPCGLSMVRNQVKVKLKIRYIGGGYREDGFEEAVNFDFPLIQGQDLYIKSVCDGLVCLVIGRTTLVVWNPSIRQHRILPLPHYPGDSHADFEIFGLGYDSTIDDYKVVRLPSSICRVQVIGAYFMPGKCLLQAQVFNLKSNNWRSIQDFPYIIGEHHQTSISVQGGLHWLAVLDHDPKHLILRFDLADETFSEIALPPHLESVNSRFLSLGLRGGFLSMLRDREFWVMKGDGEQGWTKVMTIPHVQAPQDSSYTSLAKPLCLTNSGKVLIVVACKKLVLYDPRELAVRELNIRSLPDAFFKDTLYLESLVSPCSGNVDVQLQ